jgi:hypothetical protein
MKNILIPLLLITNSFAIEIQCFSETESIHSTIVKEDNTPRTFLVFDDGVNFLNYFQLDQNLLEVTDTTLNYKDEEIEISVSSNEDGLILSKSEHVLFGKMYSNLSVSNCKFINTEI